MKNKKHKIQLRNYLISRQSFSDRICDDLCEVLLSYLSFEHKIQFECISKQFQRCLYTKQNVLEIRDESERRNNLKKLLSLKDRKINLQAFESVLKKCQFINKIIIKESMSESNSECVLQLITKYCNHLKEIEFNFNEISEQTLRSFGEKCGKKLLKIRFYGNLSINDEKYYNKLKSLLRLTRNCIELNNDKKGFPIDLCQLVDKNEILVPKLRKVMLSYNLNFKLMETFVNNYENTLKSVRIEFRSKDDDYGINVLMQQIIRFQSLEELKLILCFKNEKHLQFIRSLEAIGLQCSQLKRLELHFFGTNLLHDRDIFNAISSFEQLKYFQLKTNNFFKPYQMSYQVLSQSLIDCKNITHLTLNLFEIINDNFFINIHMFLPQLKYLKLSTHHNITDIAMNSLSKLPKLQTICLYSFSGFNGITDAGVCDVINNCLQIKSINFNSRPNITHKTIDALIALALRKPRIQYSFDLNYLGEESESDFDVYNNNFPDNLVIK